MPFSNNFLLRVFLVLSVRWTHEPCHVISALSGCFLPVFPAFSRTDATSQTKYEMSPSLQHKVHVFLFYDCEISHERYHCYSHCFSTWSLCLPDAKRTLFHAHASQSFQLAALNMMLKVIFHLFCATKQMSIICPNPSPMCNLCIVHYSCNFSIKVGKMRKPILSFHDRSSAFAFESLALLDGHMLQILTEVPEVTISVL